MLWFDMIIICVCAHPRTCSQEFKTVLCAHTHFISCIQCFHNKFLLADENDILIILIVILCNANILNIGYYSDVYVCISFSLISLKSKNSSSFAHSSLSLYVRIRDSRQGSGSFVCSIFIWSSSWLFIGSEKRKFFTTQLDILTTALLVICICSWWWCC